MTTDSFFFISPPNGWAKDKVRWCNYFLPGPLARLDSKCIGFSHQVLERFLKICKKKKNMISIGFDLLPQCNGLLAALHKQLARLYCFKKNMICQGSDPMDQSMDTVGDFRVKALHLGHGLPAILEFPGQLFSVR